MNWLDITILCLLGVGLIKGLVDGMIKQVVAVIALIIGIYLCSAIAVSLSDYLKQLAWFPKEAILVTSYLLGFVVIVGVILLAGNIVHRLIEATPLSFLNHIIGGFVGVVLTILMISVLFNLIEIVDHRSALLPHEIKIESRYYYVIKDIIASCFPGNLFGLKNDIFT